MIPIQKSYRHIWQPPRKAGEKLQERQVTFLELFYDVVYVAIIAQLAHKLASNMTGQGILEFVFLFTIVWWGWFNGTIYHDLHGNNDLRTRVFTFLQMLAVVSMAIYAKDAIGKTSKEFAFSYAAFQLILTILWWRTGIHDKKHRPLSHPYSLFFLINTILFAISPFIAEPYRYYFWFSSLLIALMLPVYLWAAAKKKETLKVQVQYITQVSPSLVERFGLFTIVVLGEIIIGVVNSASGSKIDAQLGLPIAIGTLIAIGIWRVYFDFISHRKPRCGIHNFAYWYYLHLPLTIGISVIGATMLHIVEYIGEPLPKEMQLIFTTGSAIFMICSALLIPIIVHTDHSDRYYKTASIVLFFSAAGMFIMGLLELNTLILLALTIVLLLLPFLLSFRVWLHEVKNKASQQNE